MLLPKAWRGIVPGVLFAKPGDSAVLQALDADEECAPYSPETSLFLRRKRTATLPNGPSGRHWVYVYNREFSAST